VHGYLTPELRDGGPFTADNQPLYGEPYRPARPTQREDLARKSLDRADYALSYTCTARDRPCDKAASLGSYEATSGEFIGEAWELGSNPVNGLQGVAFRSVSGRSAVGERKTCVTRRFLDENDHAREGRSVWPVEPAVPH